MGKIMGILNSLMSFYFYKNNTHHNNVLTNIDSKSEKLSIIDQLKIGYISIFTKNDSKIKNKMINRMIFQNYLYIKFGSSYIYPSINFPKKIEYIDNFTNINNYRDYIKPYINKNNLLMNGACWAVSLEFLNEYNKKNKLISNKFINGNTLEQIKSNKYLNINGLLSYVHKLYNYNVYAENKIISNIEKDFNKFCTLKNGYYTIYLYLDIGKHISSLIVEENNIIYFDSNFGTFKFKKDSYYKLIKVLNLYNINFIDIYYVLFI